MPCSTKPRSISTRSAPPTARSCRRYPGDRAARQPVHTVYGGAQLFKAETTSRLGEAGAARRMDTYGRDAGRLRPRRRLHRPMPRRLAGDDACTSACRRKLEREPVEDFRIDFEDGFGARPDAEEDATAISRRARGGARACARARCRRSSASASSRSARSGRRAARARSRSSSTRCSARPAAACPPTSWSRCPRSRSPSSRARWCGCSRSSSAATAWRQARCGCELMIEVTQALSAPTAARRCPASSPRARAAASARTSAPTTTPPRATSPRRTRCMDHPWCDLAKGNDAARLRRHRHLPLRRRRPTCCRSAPHARRRR